MSINKGVLGYMERFRETLQYNVNVERLAKIELWLDLYNKANREFPLYPQLFFVANLGLSWSQAKNLYKNGYIFYKLEELFEFALRLGIIRE